MSWQRGRGEFLFLKRSYLCLLFREEETRSECMWRYWVFTPDTVTKALIVLLDDIRAVSVLYCKVRMSHSLMFKIHQDLRVNWDFWQMTLKQSSAMWYFFTTRKKSHSWQLRNGDQILKPFFPLKGIWNIKLRTEVVTLLGSPRA